MLHRAAQRPGCIRFSFGTGPQRGPAKPSGLGMVSGSLHIAGRATDASYRPEAVCSAAGPHRAADGREPWPWSCEHEKKTFFS